MTDTVVFVVLDSLRFDIYRDYLNSSDAAALSNIAQESTEFTGATAPAPWSLPSHASMFTGQYPVEHGALRISDRIATQTPTLLDFTSEIGYKSACFTKNPFVSPNYGFNGWDLLNDHYGRAIFPDAERLNSEKNGVGEYIDGVKQILKSDTPVKSFINSIYSKGSKSPPVLDDGAKQIVKDFSNYLELRKGEDLFCFINFMETHDYHKVLSTTLGRLNNILRYSELEDINGKFGWAGVENYKNNSNIQITQDDILYFKLLVYDELKYIDRQIEKLWESLERNDRADNCLFILCADHGEALGEDGFYYHVAGVTEPLVRVPLLIRHPETTHDQINDRVSLNWIFSTVLNFMGVSDQGPNLLQPETYPQYVGTQNTGRILDLVNDESSIPDKILSNRTAVYHSDNPNRKFLKEDNVCRARKILSDRLSEEDADNEEDLDPAEIIQTFESTLNTIKSSGSELTEELEKKLDDLGYI